MYIYFAVIASSHCHRPNTPAISNHLRRTCVAIVVESSYGNRPDKPVIIWRRTCVTVVEFTDVHPPHTSVIHFHLRRRSTIDHCTPISSPDASGSHCSQFESIPIHFPIIFWNCDGNRQVFAVRPSWYSSASRHHTMTTHFAHFIRSLHALQL